MQTIFWLKIKNFVNVLKCLETIIWYNYQLHYVIFSQGIISSNIRIKGKSSKYKNQNKENVWEKSCFALILI